MTRIKICGCMQAADAVAAADAGADFVGVMFATESRRRISPEEAAVIVRALGTPLREMEQAEPSPLIEGTAPGIVDGRSPEAWLIHGAHALERLLARKRPLVVGVFQDQSVEEISEIAEVSGIDLVQLSGNEAWSDALMLNRLAVKAIRPRSGMTESEILAQVRPGTAIALMLDPSHGTGVAAELPVAAAVAARVPLWLAGGLSPANVAAVVGDVRPWLVDVSTGVETGGAKDATKITAFCREVRSVM